MPTLQSQRINDARQSVPCPICRPAEYAVAMGESPPETPEWIYAAAGECSGYREDTPDYKFAEIIERHWRDSLGGQE